MECIDNSSVHDIAKLQGDASRTMEVLDTLGAKLREVMTPGSTTACDVTSAKSVAYACAMGDLYRDVYHRYRTEKQIDLEIDIFEAGLAFMNGGGNCNHYATWGEYLIEKIINPRLQSEGITISSVERLSNADAKHTLLQLTLQSGATIAFDPSAMKNKYGKPSALVECCLFKENAMIIAVNRMQDTGYLRRSSEHLTWDQAVNLLCRWVEETEADLQHSNQKEIRDGFCRIRKNNGGFELDGRKSDSFGVLSKNDSLAGFPKGCLAPRSPGIDADR